MFARLRHRTVSSGHNQNSSVHLRGAGDHVLNVVGVPRTVNVRIVALIRFVFNVRRVDRDTAGAFFRCLIDVRIVNELGFTLLRQYFRNRRRQRRLPMVNVTYRADIAMRLRSLKLLFCHFLIPDYKIIYTKKPPKRRLEPLDQAFLACVTGFFSVKKPFIGAGDGNRTHVVSLEGFCSTIELHPQNGGWG